MSDSGSVVPLSGGVDPVSSGGCVMRGGSGVRGGGLGTGGGGTSGGDTGGEGRSSGVSSCMRAQAQTLQAVNIRRACMAIQRALSPVVQWMDQHTCEFALPPPPMPLGLGGRLLAFVGRPLVTPPSHAPWSRPLVTPPGHAPLATPLAQHEHTHSLPAGT